VNFKIDENLRAEATGILRTIGFVADTVADENLSGAKDEIVATASRSEGRILVTLDLDFANIRAYPPCEHSGIIVLRVKAQDKATVLAYARRSAAALTCRNPSDELWILDGNRIRFRQGN
jgi:predicted nuclease of predicted toxin-antitoxin system